MRAAAALLRRLLLACVAVVLVVGHPDRPSQAAIPGHVEHQAHHGQHGTPAHEHTTCCDLCVVHCGALFAPGSPAGAPAAMVHLVRSSTSSPPTVPVASLRHRLPQALAPPSLLA